MTFELPLQVYWEDTDAGGIVYHANYLRFFERARTSWLRSLGIGQHQLQQETGGMFIVSDCTLKFLMPARIDDALVASAQVLECGRAQLSLAQQVLRRMDNHGLDVLCRGTVRLGWVNCQTMRPARIPEKLIEKILL